MKSKINKRRYINYVRKILPVSLRLRYDSAVDWLKYVVYQRWYKTKLLGAVNFIKYLTVKRLDINNEKKILAIVDFSATGTALGFFIILQIRLLCEAYLNKINKIDFALVYNSENFTIGHLGCVSDFNAYSTAIFYGYIAAEIGDSFLNAAQAERAWFDAVGFGKAEAIVANNHFDVGSLIV